MGPLPSIDVADALLDERRELSEWATTRCGDFHYSRSELARQRIGSHRRIGRVTKPERHHWRRSLGGKSSVQVNRTSEFAQASYFAGIMRTELVEARKAAKEAQRRWSSRRVSDNIEIPEPVIRLKRRVREADRVLKALEKRFPGI